MTTPNLWGDLGEIKRIQTPKSVLQEQADYLNQATSGVIRAEIDDRTQGELLQFDLSLVAPALNNYRYTLLSVRHYVLPYPLEILDQTGPGLWIECDNEEDFMDVLKDVLGGERGQQVVSSLLSQSE